MDAPLRQRRPRLKSQSVHAQAWINPYYQIDYVFDGSQQICFNCHIPLENQQEDLVVGFRDKEMFKPILEPNPDFDQALQNEGVTFTLTNVGAAHFLPTGTPDRHLTLELRLLDGEGRMLKEKIHVMKRYILWRPFIVDLKDTRA